MNSKGQTNLTFDKVKQLVPIEQVLAWLGVDLKKHGREFRAICPLPGHTEKTASFSVGGKRPNLFFCFGCGGRGDIFDACQLLKGFNKHEAFTWIVEQAGLAKSAGENQQSSRPANGCLSSRTIAQSAFTATVLSTKTIDKANAEAIFFDVELYHDIYQALIELLPFDGWALKEIQRRGLDSNKFHAHGYRSLPCDKQIRVDLASELAHRFKLSDSRRVAGFFRLENEHWCFAGNSRGEREFFAAYNGAKPSFQVPALIFPSRSASGKIQLLKLRNPDFPFHKINLDKSIVDEWKRLNDPRFDRLGEALKFYPPKYQVVASPKRDAGCSIELNTHYSLFANHSEQRFILTEGELKGDVIADRLRFPVAALAGVNLHQDKFLRQLLNLSGDSLEKSPELPANQISCLADLYEQTAYNYTAANFPELLTRLQPRSVIFAFDRDNSKAVINSLLKFRSFKDQLGVRCDYCFYYLFWNEREAKGFDDLLVAEHNFSILPLASIWESIAQ